MQEVRAGVNTWAVAARDKWAMDAAKADRVPVLIAIDDADEVVGAWPVTGVSNESSVPPGKTRKVNRALSEVEEDRAQLFKDSGWVEPEDKPKTSTTK